MSALQLRAFLERLDGCAEPPSVVAGFDAFVDEILHVVQHRSSPEHYEPVPGLADMGALFQVLDLPTVPDEDNLDAIMQQASQLRTALGLNAGVSAGLALDAPWAECLAAGTACSGVFVRQARSARRQDLADFATAWAAGTLDVA